MTRIALSHRRFISLASTAFAIGMFLETGGANHVFADQAPSISGQQTLPVSSGRALDAAKPPTTQPVGSFPDNLLASPDGKYVISTDAGFRQALWSIRTSDGAGVSHVDFAGKRRDPNGLYYGLAIAPDGTVYAAQGAKDAIAVLSLAADGTLTLTGSIPTRKADFPAGLALDGRGFLYVTNNDPSPIRTRRGSVGASATEPVISPAEAHETTTAVGLNASVAIYDAKSAKETGRLELAGEVPGTSVYPLSIAALKDGRRVYAASERDGGLYVIDASDAVRPKNGGFISTGANPDALLLNKAESRLYVGNAGSDTVSVIDTTSDKVIATVLLRPEIARDLAGATPTGLALSPDEDTLYVTLGDMNAVAVVDLDDSPSPVLRGFIPTGWYPSAVAVSPDGKRLFVADAKGIQPRIPHDASPSGRVSSPLNLIEGVVTTLAAPTSKQLPELTQRALAAARITPANFSRENPLAGIGLGAGKISHVIYIVKENRTYDQVLGDLPQGDGDPKRCIFGRDITPNQHALAERFVLLDNFFDSGDVSGDGWVWSTQASANENVTRNVPYQYSNRGRRYDFEGQNNDYLTGGFPAKDVDGKPLSDDARFKNGAKPVPDVGAAPGGHLWDLAIKHKINYRNFGFFVSDGVTQNGKTIIPNNFPTVAALQPAGHDLEGVTDIDYRGFALEYADSDARAVLARQNHDDVYLTPVHSYGKHSAPSRFSEWKTEFDQMLAKDPTGAAVPALMTVRLCCDHTAGMSPDKHTPRSMVADNDYAVGQCVEAVSRSPIWAHTAFFIIEDDAQNGPDHVDIHRSTCYVISPYIKEKSIDHSYQNTVSVIKTIELLLGLPPMNQFDASIAPIMDWTSEPKNAEVFKATLPDAKIIAEMTEARSEFGASDPKWRQLIAQSAAMDFTHADRAPAEELNRIIWASVRGTRSEMPPTPSGPMQPGKRPAKDKDDD